MLHESSDGSEHLENDTKARNRTSQKVPRKVRMLKKTVRLRIPAISSKPRSQAAVKPICQANTAIPEAIERYIMRNGKIYKR